MWPSSARRADRTAIHLPVEDEPAADARAEGEHHHVARSASGADLPLGERRRVRVVVDPDREREALPHPVAEVEIGERNVHGRDRPARALVDRRGEPEADRDHTVSAQLLDHFVQAGEQILLGPGGSGPLQPGRRSRPRDR